MTASPPAKRMSALVVAALGLVASAVLTPGGTAPSAADAESVELPRMGFNWSSRIEPADIQRTLNAGATTNRIAVDWGRIETIKGIWNWSSVKPTYDALIAAGQRPLLRFVGAPVWATGLGRRAPLPTHDASWQTFVKKAIAQMPEAIGIEVWNEPNHNGPWGATPDPERYAELVTLTDQAAAQTPQDPPVAIAGMFPTRQTNALRTAVAQDEFLRLAFEAGMSYDVLGVHSYPRRDPHDPEDSFVRYMMEDLAQLWAVAEDFGPRPQTWITEMGISTSGLPDQMATEAEQAEQLVAMIETAAGTGYVPLVIIHKIRDQVDVDLMPWGTYLGVRHANNAPKPAYCAIAALYGVPGPCV